MRILRLVPAIVLAAACLSGAHAAATDSNGVFRFLTQTLPDGSTNAEYVARLITANADGAVTFGLALGSNLPTGMSLDGATGYITGRPTSTANTTVTFTAFDGVTTIQWAVGMHVNASGGGGNGGSTFGALALAPGRVGTAYSHTVSVTGGVGPFVFGAASLPPGLSLNGETGALTGTPAEAGTYFVALSVLDHGENNNVVTVQPLVVLPATSDFKFTTTILNNGEVGTPYCDLYVAAGGAGTVTYGASGLPAGLAVDAATGAVSGTPEVAGLFQPVLVARDGTSTISTNLTMLVAPSATSSFYWDFAGVPAAFAGVTYTRQPPILVSAQNWTTIAYAVTGLPPGITYNALTGELAGVATEIGEYPVTLTATDTTNSTVLSLSLDFLVLPPTGGDAGSVAVNLWTTKQRLDTGTPGKDSWTGTCIYNADRRTGALFDRATDGVSIGVGSRTISVLPGTMTGTTKTATFKSPKGEKPAVTVSVSSATQVVKWSSVSDTLTETLPAAVRLATVVGDRGWRLDELLGADGRFRAPTGFRRPAFVVAAGKARLLGPAKDTATLSMLLADPAFAYEAGVSKLRVRILSGTTVLVDRDFTALGTSTTVTDKKTKLVSTKVKTLKDEALADRVTQFSYSTKTGKLSLSLSALTLTALPAGEAHLGVEITIGTRIAYTAVTFFAPVAGRYSTKM